MNQTRKRKTAGKNNKKCKYNKTAKLKPENCSPTSKYKYTCYSNKSLHLLKQYWNFRHPDCKITTNDNYKIWVQLKNYMYSTCKRESCWLNRLMKKNLNNELLSYTFAPQSPESWKRKPTTWLNSLDIENVMKQYEKKYPNFEFIGPSPIDFNTRKMYGECVWNELCNFNLKKTIDRKKTKIGIIFNTDPHYLGGSHWISMFIDIKKKCVYFFDSVGDLPPKQIYKFVNNVVNQGRKINIYFNFMMNHPVEHQEKDTECGMYSLYFIIKMLQGASYKNLFLNKNNLIRDKEMLNLRKKYFSF
tara:strand:+ start:297 stop:1202 length:906 start_codon:yes stop_codon:yes gene_type:complete